MDKILGVPIGAHHRIEPTRCPACGGRHSCHANAAGAGAPEPGDFSVCAHCGALLVFEQDLALRKATPEETAKATADPEVGALIRVTMTRAKALRQHRMRMGFMRN